MPGWRESQSPWGGGGNTGLRGRSGGWGWRDRVGVHPMCVHVRVGGALRDGGHLAERGTPAHEEKKEKQEA